MHAFWQNGDCITLLFEVFLLNNDARSLFCFSRLFVETYQKKNEKKAYYSQCDNDVEFQILLTNAKIWSLKRFNRTMQNAIRRENATRENVCVFV